MGHPKHSLELFRSTSFSYQVHLFRHSFFRFLIGHFFWDNLKDRKTSLPTRTPAAAIVLRLYLNGSQSGKILPTREYLAMSGDNFGCHIWRLLLPLCPTMHRTALAAKNYSAESVNNAEVEKSCCHQDFCIISLPLYLF